MENWKQHKITLFVANYSSIQDSLLEKSVKKVFGSIANNIEWVKSINNIEDKSDGGLSKYKEGKDRYDILTNINDELTNSEEEEKFIGNKINTRRIFSIADELARYLLSKARHTMQVRRGMKEMHWIYYGKKRRTTNVSN